MIDARPTGACVGVSFQVASRDVGRRLVVGGRARCDVLRHRSRCRTRRAGARTPSATASCCSICRAIPKAPASVSQTAYADGALTLRVDPGEARLAYPALTGFVIRSNGQDVAQCAADGTCPPIAAPNGEQRTYDAFARNSVGTSRSSVRTVAWAYDSPGAPTTVQVRPVVTSGEGGVVALHIEGIDPEETGTIKVSSPAGETVQIPIRRNDTSIDLPQYRVGSNTSSPITVTPYSRFDLPPGLGGSPSGAAATVWGNGIGAPTAPSLVAELGIRTATARRR